MRFTSDDAEIHYETMGAGAPVVLLHPFPVHHGFWLPVAEKLASRYRLILPDLRGHGESTPGRGAATMQKHAEDLLRLLDREGLARAMFAGISISGYVLMQLWRQAQERFDALVLMNTRAGADSDEVRAGRIKAIENVRAHGPAAFLDAQLPRLLGETTRRTRPDIAARARELMQPMTIAGIAAVQQGMAERPDSTETMRSIRVPTLIIGGNEDQVIPLDDLLLMQRLVPGSRLEVIDRTGHFTALEKPDELARLLRQFLEKVL